MNDDPYQNFLHFLYNNRYILGFVLFFATINAIATIFDSLTSIQKFIVNINSWYRTKFYSKNKLIKDSFLLSDEINTFFKYRDLLKPQLNPKDMINSRMEIEKYNKETQVEFDKTYKSRIRFIRDEYLKYNLSVDIFDKFDKFVLSPKSIENRQQFIHTLIDVGLLLKAKGDIKKSQK